MREKLILSGLFLSKFDLAGLKELGFSSFVEAFNVIGFALGAKPASIKNYRDEFDPLFPNKRKGWHKRSTRKYCLDILTRYGDLDRGTFAGLLKSFVGNEQRALGMTGDERDEPESESSFAKRLVTGLAAEHYFESVQPKLPEFSDFSLENTTRFGCGYDYRLTQSGRKDFLAVEVKGLAERTGCLSLTQKEYQVAAELEARYFLFVVRNFRESPVHSIYQHPLGGRLEFAKKERLIIQVSWLTSI